MKIGAITGYIDVAQLVLYAFWIFFFSVIYYIRREDKREGYPLESDRTDRAPRVKVQGFPSMPAVKTFKLMHGQADARSAKPDLRPVAARPISSVPGSPLEPTGNPMLDGVGPAAFAERADVPDLTFEGQPKIVPLRVATDYHVDSGCPNPIGMKVFGGDGRMGAMVRDIWVDRSEPTIRYLEVEVDANQRRVLVPIGFCTFDTRNRCVNVRSIFAKHFADVPGTRMPDQVTLLEEDKISGYYGGGTLYASRARSEPLL